MVKISKVGNEKIREMAESTLASSQTFFRVGGNSFCLQDLTTCPVSKLDSHLQRLLHVSKCIPCEVLCGLQEECPQSLGLDMHQSLPDFDLLRRKNKRRHTEISNFVHRQVSKLAKVNEIVPVVLHQTLLR